MTWSGAAWAETRSFNIERQPLANALTAFSEQSHRPVLVKSDMAAGKMSAGVSGVLDADVALTRVLEGTGLSYERAGEHFVIVERADHAPQPVAAAEPAKGDAASPPSPSELEEVVVTALRRTESLSKAPAQVSVVEAEQLARQGVTDFRGLQNILPSAVFQEQAFQTKVYIRGVGQFTGEDQLDPAVAMYVDQVYMPRPASWSSFFDLDQVEVLAGPQGTLYGRNSVGGALLLTTKKPGKEFGGEATIRAGNYSLFAASAAVNLPVNDDLSVRVALDSDNHGGYFSDGLDARRRDAARVSVAYDPTSKLSTLFVVEYDFDDGAQYAVINKPSYPDPNDPRYLPLDINRIGYETNVNTLLTHAQFDYQFDNGTKLTYIPSYTHYHNRAFVPANGQNFDEHFRGDQVTNELRLSGDYGKLNWLIGGFQFYSNSTSDSLITQGNFGVLNPNDFGALFAKPYTQIAHQGPEYNTTNSLALFGQGVYSITDKARLTVGLRYSYDKRRGDVAGLSVSLPFGSKPGGAPVFIAPLGFDETRHWTHIDYKIGLDYDLGPRSLVYANVQTSYLPGGYQDSAQKIASFNWFKPESLIGLAVGSKNRFFDNRLQLDFEAFYYDYKNYQISDFNLNTGTTGFLNAQKAILYGIDIHSKLQVTSADRISVDVSLLSAKFDEFVLPGGVTNYDDFTMPNAPKFTTTIGYEHRWDFSNGAGLRAAVSSHHQSSSWGHHTHAIASYVPGYTRTDANLTYYAPSGKWDVGAWIKNIENVNHYAAIGLGGKPGPAAGSIEPPRTYGLKLGVSF